MKRHVVICGLFRYPRGNATSNYVQYWADALKLAGYKVTILSYVNKEYTSKQHFLYRGVDVIDLENHISIIPLQRLLNGRLFQFRMKQTIKKLKLNNEDVVAVCDFSQISNPVLKKKKKYHYKTCGYPLEWFHKEFINNEKRAQIREAEFQRNKEHDIIFPISHLIAQQFELSGAIVDVIPIMADAEEFQYKEKDLSNGKYELIYPANGALKDALDQMLVGLSLLSKEEQSRIILHIKGVKKEYVQNLLGENTWETMKDVFVFHEWLEYADLVKLYQSCHYLLLARETNQMTMANFPSKVPEVMTHGVVPIVTNVGDYTKYYLFDGENSIVFDGCEPQTVADAIRKAISLPYDEYKRLSINARKTVEDKFDYHNWVVAYQTAIEKAFLN